MTYLSSKQLLGINEKISSSLYSIFVFNHTPLQLNGFNFYMVFSWHNKKKWMNRNSCSVFKHTDGYEIVSLKKRNDLDYVIQTSNSHANLYQIIKYKFPATRSSIFFAVVYKLLLHNAAVLFILCAGYKHVLLLVYKSHMNYTNLIPLQF